MNAFRLLNKEANCKMNPLIVKVIIMSMLLLIFVSLGSGLWYLLKDKDHSTRGVKALTWRIGLSFLLFVLLLIAFAVGWISPH